MTQRLQLDVREVRDRMRLRLLAALPAFAGGVWLLWAADSLLLRLVAGAGLVFATVWVVRARTSVTQLASAGDHYLETDPEGLTVRSGAQVRRLAWSEIDAVEIDEDRLVVQLRLHGVSRPLAIEPQYGELGLYELGEWIQRARPDRPDQMAGVRSPQS